MDPSLQAAALRNGAHVKQSLTEETTGTALAKVAELERRRKHSMIPLRELVDRLDGGDPNGPWHRYVWNVISAASYRYYDMVRGSNERVQEVLRSLPMVERRRIKETPLEVDGNKYTVENAIVVALNCGNESNLTKMVRGMSAPGVFENHGIVPWFGRRTVDQILAHLTQRDVDLVNEIHRTLEARWPDMSDLEKKDSGTVPPKVQARPFKFIGADGKELTIGGGYYPMIYHPKFRAGKMQAEAVALSENGMPGLFQPGYERMMTPTGHLQARVETFAKPIDLTLDALPRKLTQEAKDIAFRIPGKQLYRILVDDRTIGALHQALGDRGPDLVLKHLQDAVNDVMLPDVGAGFWTHLIRGLRSQTYKAIFSLNVAQAAQNLADTAGTGEVVPRRFWTRASLQLARDQLPGPSRGEQAAWMLEKFPEMRLRAEGLKASLAQDLRSTFRRSEIALKWEQVQDVMMLPFETTQKMTEFPTCLGSYLHAIEPKESGGLGLAEDAAVQHAQDAVLRMFGGKRTVDLSPIQRDRILRHFTMFWGWAGAQVNKFMRANAHAGRQWSEGQRRNAVLTLWSTYSRLGAIAIASELLVGRSPKKDKDEDEMSPADVAEWAAWKAVMLVPQSMPIVGSTFRGIAGGFQGETSRDVSMTPWTNLLNAVVKAGQKSARAVSTVADQGELDDDQELDLFMAWLEAGGGLAGGPVSQVRATVAASARGRHAAHRRPRDRLRARPGREALAPHRGGAVAAARRRPWRARRPGEGRRQGVGGARAGGAGRVLTPARPREAPRRAGAGAPGRRPRAPA